ncbi:MAG TPA: nucleotidyltransferase family protein [Armatimonadota bacterium]
MQPSTAGKTSPAAFRRDELTQLARLAVMGRADALAKALASAPDPLQLVDAARFHGLAPIFHAFTQRHAELLPPDVAKRLSAYYVQNKARAIVLLTEAARAMQALEAQGIPCIPLKGAALAEDLYGDPALRPMTDVDLLVPHAAVPAARKVMLSFGYDEEEGDLREGFEEEFRSELSFFRTKPIPARVEIHWGLLNFGGQERWTEAAIERSVMTPRGRRLTDEDTLLYLAAHAAYHHQNDRLLWEFDIALLIQARAALLDPDVLAVLSQEHRLVMPFRWALETAEKLGVTPAPTLTASMENRSVGRVERWMLRFARDPQFAGAVRTVMTIRSTPGARRRMRLIGAKLFPDRKHLTMRHGAHGFWPWVYAKRLLSLSGRLLVALLRRHRDE